MYYTFTATNHRGVRLPWYFDDIGQASRAYGFAFATPASATTVPVEVDKVPADDYLTDAGEFARWLSGDMADDALAMGEQRVAA